MTYSRNNGGRVLLLFLLFLLALYQLTHAGFSTFAVVCLLPLLVVAIYSCFKWKMLTFWMLIIINYFLQMKGVAEQLPVPMSLPNEMLEIILLAIAIVDARENPHFEKCANLMLFALMIWCVFCTLQMFNDTCDLGFNIASWYTGARLMAFQLLYAFLVFSIYISSPKILLNYLRIWALLSLFSAYWTYKQKNIGFTHIEYSWLYYGAGQTTHLLNAGTLIRYFSTFSDAANYGCNAAAAATSFIIITITSKITWERIFFLVISICVIWGMFQSGTRTAIFCLAAGLMLFIVLSKSVKMAVPIILLGLISFILLAFTNIGQGNNRNSGRRT